MLRDMCHFHLIESKKPVNSVDPPRVNYRFPRALLSGIASGWRLCLRSTVCPLLTNLLRGDNSQWDLSKRSWTEGGMRAYQGSWVRCRAPRIGSIPTSVPRPRCKSNTTHDYKPQGFQTLSLAIRRFQALTVINHINNTRHIHNYRLSSPSDQ